MGAAIHTGQSGLSRPWASGAPASPHSSLPGDSPAQLPGREALEPLPGISSYSDIPNDP